MARRQRDRLSVARVRVDPNLRCERIYPIEGTNKTVADLQTVGIKLTPEQATALAKALLVAAQDWEDISITGKRKEQRKSNGTFPLTVTGF
jgi:hypothetical protein